MTEELTNEEVPNVVDVTDSVLDDSMGGAVAVLDPIESQDGDADQIETVEEFEPVPIDVLLDQIRQATKNEERTKGDAWQQLVLAVLEGRQRDPSAIARQLVELGKSHDDLKAGRELMAARFDDQRKKRESDEFAAEVSPLYAKVVALNSELAEIVSKFTREKINPATENLNDAQIKSGWGAYCVDRLHRSCSDPVLKSQATAAERAGRLARQSDDRVRRQIESKREAVATARRNMRINTANGIKPNADDQRAIDYLVGEIEKLDAQRGEFQRQIHEADSELEAIYAEMQNPVRI